MTEKRPNAKSVAPTPEPLKPERISSRFSFFAFIIIMIPFVALFIQSTELQERVKEILKSPMASTSTMPSTLISRDAVYISEVITDDPVEQEEIDQAFDAFSGRQGGIYFDVLSLWNVYQYLVVEKHRPQYYNLSFTNSPPVWRTDEKTKRRDLRIDGQQMSLEARTEKTMDGNKPWPDPYFARIVKVGVILGDSVPKEGWIRFIATKDFQIHSYGEKYPRTDRVADAKFSGGEYAAGKKTIYTQVVP